MIADIVAYGLTFSTLALFLFLLHHIHVTNQVMARMHAEDMAAIADLRALVMSRGAKMCTCCGMQPVVDDSQYCRYCQDCHSNRHHPRFDAQLSVGGQSTSTAVRM